MQNSANRLMDLIDSLLHYSRAEQTRVSVRRESFDLSVTAREIVEELRPTAGQKGLELSLRTNGHAPRITSDIHLVRLILVYLIANAVKFTERGQVEVSIERIDGNVKLAVRDTGPGIAPEDPARIFEPFQQLEALPNKHLPGIGLGLALVRHMTTALGGSVDLESEIGSGCRFIVTLPAGEA